MASSTKRVSTEGRAIALSPSEIEARIGWLRSVHRELLKHGLVEFAMAVESRARGSLSQLDNRDLKHIVPELARCGVTWKMPKDEILQRCGVDVERSKSASQSCKDESSGVRWLKIWLTDCARQSRSSCWAWRAGQENAQRLRDGWFPFFNTLTVDPSRGDAEAIFRDGVEWRRYVQRFAEVIRKACGYKQGEALRADYFRFMGYVEHGQMRRDHFHLHALVWCRDIPDRWKLDPNLGRPYPGYRDIPFGNSMWPHGFAKLSPFRCTGDPWRMQLGWMVPVGPGGRPMRLSPPEMAGKYVCKYIGKYDGRRSWLHQVKATRVLGLEDLRAWLDVRSWSDLYRLATRPVSTDCQGAASYSSDPPASLVRAEARRALLARMSVDPRQAERMLRTLFDRPVSTAFADMCASVDRGHEPWRMAKHECMDWFSCHLPTQLDLDSARKVSKAWRDVGKDFPKRRYMSHEALAGVSTRDRI